MKVLFNRDAVITYLENVDQRARDYSGQNFSHRSVRKEQKSNTFSPPLFIDMSRHTRSGINIGNHYETHHYTTIHPPTASPRPLTEKEKAAEEKKQDELYFKVALAVGAAIFAVGSFCLGFVAKEGYKAHVALQETKKLKRDCDKIIKGGIGSPQLRGVCDRLKKDVIPHALKMDEAAFAAQWKYTASVLGGVSGAALLIGGGLAAAPFCITAGKLALIISPACGLGALTWHWNDQKDLQKTYQNIIRKVEVVLPAVKELPDISLTSVPEPSAPGGEFEI